MPKRTTYSRSSAHQRSRPKQKAFELVRPASDENVLESDAENEQASVGRKTAVKVDEVEEIDQVEEEEADEEQDEAEKSAVKKPELVTRAAQTKKTGARKKGESASSASSSEVAPRLETGSEAPKSAAARLAARREAAQRTQHSTSHAISAENYAYVRKDLIFILVLALIMFSAIIVLHFVIGN